MDSVNEEEALSIVSHVAKGKIVMQKFKTSKRKRIKGTKEFA